jgi:hypothetical protein
VVEVPPSNVALYEVGLTQDCDLSGDFSTHSSYDRRSIAIPLGRALRTTSTIEKPTFKIPD